MVFSLQANGYSPEQVDQYIAKISDEYATLYDIYTHISGEYNRLAEENLHIQNEKKELSAEISRLWDRNQSLWRAVQDVRNGLRVLFRDDLANEDWGRGIRHE